MIRLVCAHCERPLQVKPNVAGHRVYCPHCLHINLVPSATVSFAAPAVVPPEHAALPSAAPADPAATQPPAPAPGDKAPPPPLAAFTKALPATQPPPGAEGTNAAAGSAGADRAPDGYEILGELGRGGMGVVYEARHTALRRLVALKMILAGNHASATNLERFRTEAESIARLQHPHIVQIHEVGEHHGLPYFSLEFCAGGSLEKKLAGTPLPPRTAAALVEQLAQAMQAAHDKGVIHRDLKPANILLTEDGTPKITDFGLAKKLDEAGNTQTGSIMGTPSYMAPEQAGGKSKELGPACDIYALGALLYECLTGRPPFRAATPLDTILQVVREEPVSPTHLNARVPRDLETICLTCLHKEARKRYGSARALADDLRRFQNGEPIRARPVGRVERATKWVKRNPLVTALAALVVLSVLGGAGGVFVKYLEAKEQTGIATRKAKETEEALIDRHAALGQARAEAAAARKAEQRAEKREQAALYQLATSNVLLAQAAWATNNAAVARERLAAVPPELRQWEWHYLTCQYQGGIFTLYGHGGPVNGVAFSPDGTQLATAGFDKTARLWDARTGQPLLRCTGHSGGVWSVAFSPNGTRLATASVDQTARLWNARTGQQLQVFKGHTGIVYCVAFSPDGTQLATASGDRTMRLWDAATGQQLQICRGHAAGVWGVSFSPDGTRLATASDDRTARLWDARTGQQVLVCKGHTARITSVVFSPAGTQLATTGDLAARLWDARTGQQLLEFRGHAMGVHCVAFSPDGMRLATTSYDKTARVWDARTGQVLLECKGHAKLVWGVAFSPEGTRLATASDDGTVRLWDARTGQPHLDCKGHTNTVSAVAFSPEGKRLATASYDQTARLWDARTGQQLQICKGHAQHIRHVAFSPEGTRLATASNDRTVRLWDAQTGESLLVCKGHTNGVLRVAFSPDGRRLATASSDRTARVWDAHTGQQLLVCKGHGDSVSGVAFSPDGKRLATASSDQTMRLWDARTGQQLQICKGHGDRVTDVAFSPDGMLLATASYDKTARLWDACTGQFLKECRGHNGGVLSVSFSPEGTRLATASDDRTARLWDARTVQPLLVCKGHANWVLSVSFSPEGTQLATASADGTARLWNARPLPLPMHDELAYRLWATRPEPDWHEEKFKEFQHNERFAAAFHLDRVLAYAPARRDTWLQQRGTFLEAALKEDAQNAAARLLLARTAWHNPTLGPKDTTALVPSVDEMGLLARRTRAGLLLRQRKADQAVLVLEAVLKERGEDQPPVEELLLAWAYLDTRQADKAQALWTKATAWVDRQPAAVRDNPFDWETAHELDVLRRELAPRFKAKKP